MNKSLIGYQVYSAREDAAKDLLGTLKTIKALGYDGALTIEREIEGEQQTIDILNGKAFLEKIIAENE